MKGKQTNKKAASSDSYSPKKNTHFFVIFLCTDFFFVVSTITPIQITGFCNTRHNKNFFFKKKLQGSHESFYWREKKWKLRITVQSFNFVTRQLTKLIDYVGDKVNDYTVVCQKRNITVDDKGTLPTLLLVIETAKGVNFIFFFKKFVERIKCAFFIIYFFLFCLLVWTLEMKKIRRT